MPGVGKVIEPHTVGFLTIPRASIKWELLAYILNMHSYSNAIAIQGARLAGLTTFTRELLNPWTRLILPEFLLL